MGQYFSDIHTSPASQFDGAPFEIADDEAVAALRGKEDYEGLLALGKALCFQLRYREAVEVYSRAIALRPEDMRAYRQRGARYISTLRPELAEADFLRCRELGGDEMDISYRLGLCRYLLGDFEGAMREMEVCFPLCDDEMGVAAIFWHALAAWSCGRKPSLLLQKYSPDMKVGHHTAYSSAMSLGLGLTPPLEALKKLGRETSDLEYSIFAYGASVWFRREGKARTANTLLGELLRRDGFWITYAYIAAWNDRKKG